MLYHNKSFCYREREFSQHLRIAQPIGLQLFCLGGFDWKMQVHRANQANVQPAETVFLRSYLLVYKGPHGSEGHHGIIVSFSGINLLRSSRIGTGPLDPTLRSHTKQTPQEHTIFIIGDPQNKATNERTPDAKSKYTIRTKGSCSRRIPETNEPNEKCPLAFVE